MNLLARRHGLERSRAYKLRMVVFISIHQNAPVGGGEKIIEKEKPRRRISGL